MNDFLILRRIGKNINYYIIDTLDLSTKKTKLVLFDRETDSFNLKIPVSKEIYNSCLDYFSDKELNYDDITPVKDFYLTDYIIHKFDEDEEIKLRSIQYTIKNIKTGELFTPYVGRHKHHEEFKKWGKYKNNFEIEEYSNIEGYQILDGNEFDKYILTINPHKMILDLSLVNLFLIRELADYVKDLFVTTSDQVDIKISYKSGRIIEVKL